MQAFWFRLTFELCELAFQAINIISKQPVIFLELLHLDGGKFERSFDRVWMQVHMHWLLCSVLALIDGAVKFTDDSSLSGIHIDGANCPAILKHHFWEL